MKFSVEKSILPFVESQFPSFYQEEGPNFILFVKAYYEWLEQEGQALNQARNLFDYRDIDNTVEDFLEHFQKKYLYGIPFNVIINKRFLLKHILDVYRSKSTINCYKLLFKLIYDEDIDVYLPGVDMLRASDGTWVEPKFLEITKVEGLGDLVGKTIMGAASGTMAVVESFITEPVNGNIIAKLYISNIMPRGGEFIVGERVVDSFRAAVEGIENIISSAPTITGSFVSLNIINGGQDFKVGDIIRIAHRDIVTNDIISYGVEGLARVTALTRSYQNLNFRISKRGFGITQFPETMIYNNPADLTGNGASFLVGSLSNARIIQYNTDVITPFVLQQIDSTYNFAANNSANSLSTLGSVLSYVTKTFGSLTSLTDIRTGNGYMYPANVFIRDVLVSQPMPGTVTFNSNSYIVTGNGTNFESFCVQEANVVYFNANTDIKANGAIVLGSNAALLAANQMIQYITTSTNTSVTELKNGGSYYVYSKNSTAIYLSSVVDPTTVITSLTPANSSAQSGHGFIGFTGNTNCDEYISLQSDPTNANTKEYAVVRAVIDDTTLLLYGPPSQNSQSNSIYRFCPTILPANFNYDSPYMFSSDGSINGKNTLITTSTISGNNIIATVEAINSGKGFVENELVRAYLYGAIETPIQIVYGGTGYANNDKLVFTSSGTSVPPQGYVSNTDANGTITEVTITYAGTNYTFPPEIYIKTSNGSGAVLEANVVEYNTYSEVLGRVVKGGIGKQAGYWSSTKGFLNSNKYIQDSYFYQDYSYQIKAAAQIDKYKSILYNTFHTAGSELFGEFQLITSESSKHRIAFEYNRAVINGIRVAPLTCDNTHVNLDTVSTTSDTTLVIY